MKKIVALTLCVLLLMSLTTAFAESNSRILQVSLEGVPDSLDPHVFSGSLCQWSTCMLHDYLVRYDQDMNIVPGIAESWEFASETELKFKLREDVYFHNGRQVTANDVKNTFDRVLDESVGSRYYANVN